MFRSPGQGDMDMTEGRLPNKCDMYVVSGVAKRWDALGEFRVVLFVRYLRLPWLGDCCLCCEVVGLLLERRSCVTGGCEGLVGVLSCSLLLFSGGRAGCRDCLPLCANTSRAGWGW